MKQYASPLVRFALALTLATAGLSPLAQAVSPPAKPAVAATKSPSILDASYKDIQSMTLLKEPDKWVGEKVSFEGLFSSFSPFALDYNGAMRSSKDYIAFLLQRPDVSTRNIPLSELKLIYPRKTVDKVMDLQVGDKVLVKGKVFSAALGDPWMDVDEVILLKKNPENVVKDAKKKSQDEE